MLIDFSSVLLPSHLRCPQRILGIWEAMEKLDTLVDDSDPDVSLICGMSATSADLGSQLLDQPHADRTSAADCRGNPKRWKARVDAGRTLLRCLYVLTAT